MGKLSVGDLVLIEENGKISIEEIVIVDKYDIRPYYLANVGWYSGEITPLEHSIKLKVDKEEVCVSVGKYKGIARHRKDDGEFDIKFALSLALYRLAKKLDTGRTITITEYAKDFLGE